MKKGINTRNIIGIVLAGGYGTRLFGPMGGSKGLFLLNGRPLIEYSLSTIQYAGANEIVIVVREDDFELRSKYSDYRQILDSGRGTFSAVLAAAKYAVDRQADAIISSCDLVCSITTAKSLVSGLFKNSDWLASFGVTPIANDQTPIWVHSEDSGRILDYGKEIQSSTYAFASIRFASLSFLQLIINTASNLILEDINTDTKLMRHLIINEKAIVGAIDIGQALDVDDVTDAEIAKGIVQTFE